jgi:ADP-heptose:LPS heptosyltransferase
VLIKIKASLLKLFVRKKITNFDIKNVKKIIFFRYDRIGDMIISTPVFRELKLNFPNINITVLASEVNKDILSNNPYIDEVFVNYKNNLLGDLKTLLKLRKYFFDVCIEFDHSVIPHAIIRLNIIKPKIIISVEKKGRYGVLGSELMMYDFFTKKKQNSHFRDIWLETLSPFGFSPSSNHYDLFCTNSQIEEAINYINKFNNKFLIGINLQGAVDGKKINFLELNQICKGLFNFSKDIQIVILSSPINYQETKEKVKRMKLSYLEASYKTKTILDAAALIKQFDLIISPDTSVVHIASTFNIPILSIHENNYESYELFAPTSNLSRTVFSKSKSSLRGFSIDQLLIYSQELIELKKSQKKSSNFSSKG